jgi:hypothetical protein
MQGASPQYVQIYDNIYICMCQVGEWSMAKPILCQSSRRDTTRCFYVLGYSVSMRAPRRTYCTATVYTEVWIQGVDGWMRGNNDIQPTYSGMYQYEYSTVEGGPANKRVKLNK